LEEQDSYRVESKAIYDGFCLVAQKCIHSPKEHRSNLFLVSPMDYCTPDNLHAIDPSFEHLVSLREQDRRPEVVAFEQRVILLGSFQSLHDTGISLDGQFQPGTCLVIEDLTYAELKGWAKTLEQLLSDKTLLGLIRMNDFKVAYDMYRFELLGPTASYEDAIRLAIDLRTEYPTLTPKHFLYAINQAITYPDKLRSLYFNLRMINQQRAVPEIPKD
jgi:hypothetical protein